MRTMKIFVVLCFVIAAVSGGVDARVATEADVEVLKRDFVEGRIQIGKTRLKDIKRLYGEPADISSSNRKLSYNYGDIKIEFDKNRYFREWKYDYSHSTAYKDEIDDLRFDLEDGQIVGELYSYEDVVSDYEEPTEAFETEEDGGRSVYYWGEIRMTFENVVVVRSLRGKRLRQGPDDGVLGTE